jgi:hypothetical protein
MSQMKIKKKPRRERYVRAAVALVTDTMFGTDESFEADKKWFNEHPGAIEYKRPPIAGEFGPVNLGDVVEVMVGYAPPSTRTRMPIVRIRRGAGRGANSPTVRLEGVAGEVQYLEAATSTSVHLIPTLGVSDPHPPDAITKVMEHVSAADRRWFEEHPGEAKRTRPPVPGEFWPMDQTSVKHVIVTKTAGGRHRCPVCAFSVAPEGVQ